MKRKTLIITGGTILGGIILYISYKKIFVAPKLSDEIDQIREQCTGANAAAQAKAADVAAQKAVGDALSPQYWQGLNKAGTIKMSAADVTRSKSDASTLNDSLGTFTWKDDVVIGLFRTFPSKAYVSMVADAFQTSYNTDLRTQMKHMSSDNLNTVIGLIANLKDY